MQGVSVAALLPSGKLVQRLSLAYYNRTLEIRVELSTFTFKNYNYSSSMRG